MIGICAYSGKMVQGVEQLILRIDRLIRTVKTSRPKRREYGTQTRKLLGKNNSQLVITSLQNLMLTELSDPANGLADFKCEQVKVLHNGQIFLKGVFQGDRAEFNIQSTKL